MGIIDWLISTVFRFMLSIVLMIAGMVMVGAVCWGIFGVIIHELFK